MVSQQYDDVRRASGRQTHWVLLEDGLVVGAALVVVVAGLALEVILGTGAVNGVSSLF